MLVGHFAIAFVGKSIEPRISLGTLALAAMTSDILWPIFSLAGFEYTAKQAGNNAPLDISYSHSLLMVAVWATLFAAGYWLLRRNSRGAWILFAAVVSHWVLDAISHKHLLAAGTHTYVGLELWNSLPATLILEGGFWLIALIVYLRSTKANRRSGNYGFWPVVVVLTFIWITNIKSGPPPPNAVIGSLIFFLLLVAWAYWMNRARSTKKSDDTCEEAD
jgi:membrane-bound metal-dependent hydrolase YbcI (DUF457 family)